MMMYKLDFCHFAMAENNLILDSLEAVGTGG